jgi:glycosyltransferase involved in cell wall biosynthesis
MGDVPERLIMHRILYLDSSVGIFGGGQISLLEFLTNMDRAKYYPLVIVGEEGKLINEIERLEVECQVIPMPGLKKLNLFMFLDGFWRIFSYAREKKVKLIHCNTSRATLYAGPIAKILGIPLIWHVRIPYPVKEEVRKKFHIDSEDIVIGTVGRLSPEKGYEHLISAIRDVAIEYPRIKVLIVGSGSEEYRLYLQEKINKLKLSSNIIFTGFYEDVPQILNCMNIYSLPSLSEGFNRSLLEAMACGLPVVATNVGGNMEVVKDGVNGLLVPSDHPVRLAAAITELLKDREKAKRMGLAGRERVEEKFSIEKNVRRTETIYEEIILKK